MRAKVADKTSRPNLTDVARNAGVSPSTVSLVLAGKAKERYISDEVIVRVQQAAAALDYSPNMLVRSMQRGKTNILSFYNCFRYGQESTDLYTVGLFTATARAAGAKGCNLLLFCDFSLSADETYHALKGGHSDGVIIFAPQPEEPLLPLLRSSRLPVVLLNSEDEKNKLSSVKDDMYDGMRQVAQRLLELGHRRIAVFAPNTSWNIDGQRRISLLRQLLSDQGIEVPERWIVPVSMQLDVVRQALATVLVDENPPTAIFCWDDYLGYVVLDACDELEVDVPGRISVIGYDGIAWPSRTRHVLASVHVDLGELSREAVDVLSLLINGHDGEPVRRLVPVTFKDGTTIGAARAG